jgi:transposase
MKNPICALDVASTSAEVCLTDSHGLKSRQARFQADEAGHRALVAMIPKGAKVIMESTGDYHRSWARACAKAGFEVYVLNGLFAKNLASAGNALRKNKTDVIDAHELARAGFVHQDELGNYRFRECEHQIANRELLKLRKRLVLTRRDQLNVATHMLLVMLPTSQSIEFADREKLHALFLKVESLEQLQSMRKTTIARYAFSQTESLLASAHSELINPILFNLMLPGFQAILRVIHDLSTHINQIQQQIGQTMQNGPAAEDLQLAQSLPGVGQITATNLVAHLPVNWRSWGPKQVVMRKIQAYFGCDPRHHESGAYKGQVRMSKRGHAPGRTALYQVAITSLRLEGLMHERYQEMRERGKAHNVAVSHLMRLHLRRLIAVLYDRTPYRPNFLQNN